MASIPTINFSQYQWEINDTNYLTKWNNFQAAIGNLQSNINQFGTDAKREVDDAISYVDAIRESYSVNLMDAYRDRITLGADFKAGRYTLDDGNTRVLTDNAADIFTVQRAGPKWLEGSDGLLREVSANSLSRDWSGGRCLGFLQEPAKTNQFRYSNDYSNSVWFKIGSSVSSDSVKNPRGEGSTLKLVENSGNGTHYLSQSVSVVAGQPYTTSVFAKSFGQARSLQLVLLGDGFGSNVRATFNLSAGTFSASAGVARIRKLSNGWYRCSLTATATATVSTTVWHALSVSPEPSLQSIFYQGDGVSGVFLFGSQFENYTIASSYIDTSDAQVTRPADIFRTPLISKEAANNGTWFLSFNEIADFSSRGILGFSSSDETLMYSNTLSSYRVFDGESGIIMRNGTSFLGNVKAAISGDSGIFSACINGDTGFEAELLDFSGEDALSLNFRLGSLSNSSAYYKQIMYIPHALGLSEMQELTKI